MCPVSCYQGHGRAWGKDNCFYESFTFYLQWKWHFSHIISKYPILLSESLNFQLVNISLFFIFEGIFFPHGCWSCCIPIRLNGSKKLALVLVLCCDKLGCVMFAADRICKVDTCVFLPSGWSAVGVMKTLDKNCLVLRPWSICPAPCSAHKGANE